jgi:hypothetical protein
MEENAKLWAGSADILSADASEARVPLCSQVLAIEPSVRAAALNADRMSALPARWAYGNLDSCVTILPSFLPAISGSPAGERILLFEILVDHHGDSLGLALDLHFHAKPIVEPGDNLNFSPLN